jgi:hypothetical protein
MIVTMKPRLISAMCWLATVLAPVLAFADEDDVKYDGRIMGYKTPVKLDGGGTALYWILLAVLAAIALSGLFKDSKRSYLD